MSLCVCSSGERGCSESPGKGEGHAGEGEVGPEEADQRSHRTGQHPALPDGHEGEQGQRTGGRAHHGESRTQPQLY